MVPVRRHRTMDDGFYCRRRTPARRSSCSTPAPRVGLADGDVGIGRTASALWRTVHASARGIVRVRGAGRCRSTFPASSDPEDADAVSTGARRAAGSSWSARITGRRDDKPVWLVGGGLFALTSPRCRRGVAHPGAAASNSSGPASSLMAGGHDRAGARHALARSFQRAHRRRTSDPR